MNIGQAAQRSGLSAKTIRYYEEIGLVVPQRHANNGYRDYVQADVDHLCFLQHARAVGFGLEECRTLLDLYRNPARHSSDVKNLVIKKIAHLDQQLASLTAMREALGNMAQSCAGNDAPDCGIIEKLAKPKVSSGMAFTLVEAQHE